MVQRFCTSGEREGVKGAVHGAACAIAATMALYNIVAWGFRRDGHLASNAVVYTVAVAWEVRQSLHHLRRCRVARSPRNAIAVGDVGRTSRRLSARAG